MKLSLNLFTLRRQVKDYALFCSKQAKAIIASNECVAELIAENSKLQRQTEELSRAIEQARLEIQRYQAVERTRLEIQSYQAVESAVTHSKGFPL